MAVVTRQSEGVVSCCQARRRSRANAIETGRSGDDTGRLRADDVSSPGLRMTWRYPGLWPSLDASVVESGLFRDERTLRDARSGFGLRPFVGWILVGRTPFCCFVPRLLVSGRSATTSLWLPSDVCVASVSDDAVSSAYCGAIVARRDARRGADALTRFVVATGRDLDVALRFPRGMTRTVSDSKNYNQKNENNRNNPHVLVSPLTQRLAFRVCVGLLCKCSALDGFVAKMGTNDGGLARQCRAVSELRADEEPIARTNRI